VRFSCEFPCFKAMKNFILWKSVPWNISSLYRLYISKNISKHWARLLKSATCYCRNVKWLNCSNQWIVSYFWLSVYFILDHQWRDGRKIWYCTRPPGLILDRKQKKINLYVWFVYNCMKQWILLTNNMELL